MRSLPLICQATRMELWACHGSSALPSPRLRSWEEGSGLAGGRHREGTYRVRHKNRVWQCKEYAQAAGILALSLCGVNVLPPYAPSSSPHPARAGLAHSSFGRQNKHPQAAFSSSYVVLKILFKLKIF